MFEFDSIKDKIVNFQKLTVKQRLDWWNNAFEFISKLPLETRKIQMELRKKKNVEKTLKF